MTELTVEKHERPFPDRSDLGEIRLDEQVLLADLRGEPDFVLVRRGARRSPRPARAGGDGRLHHDVLPGVTLDDARQGLSVTRPDTDRRDDRDALARQVDQVPLVQVAENDPRRIPQLPGPIDERPDPARVEIGLEVKVHVDRTTTRSTRFQSTCASSQATAATSIPRRLKA
jgi:hypothetical protein